MKKTTKLPKGFRLAGVKAGIKYKKRFDLALIQSRLDCVAAGVWTQNQIKAACIPYNQERINNGIRAVLVNAGCANACTGEEGAKNCLSLSAELARLLRVDSSQVLLSSTGVIGEQLPTHRILSSLPRLTSHLSGGGRGLDSIKRASRAILTTDTYEKTYGLELDCGGRVWGMAKGSGMIHPNMATMLGFVLSDVAISRELLQEALGAAVNESFNQISVDGDTSTNDMVLLLANGEAGGKPIDSRGAAFESFKDALTRVCIKLAKQIARDGEGASRLLEIEVRGARSEAAARALSRAVASSNLVKTAVFGGDANWGRIVCALGYSGAAFCANALSIDLCSKAGILRLVDGGLGVRFRESVARRIFLESKVEIVIDLHDGAYAAKAWGCDMGYDYIKINADYRS